MMMMDERAERGWRRAGPASAGGYGRSQGRAAHLSTYRRQSPHRHARGEVSSAGHPTPRGNAALKEGVGAFRSPAVAPPLGSWGGGGGGKKGLGRAGRAGRRASGRARVPSASTGKRAGSRRDLQDATSLAEPIRPRTWSTVRAADPAACTSAPCRLMSGTNTTDLFFFLFV